MSDQAALPVLLAVAITAMPAARAAAPATGWIDAGTPLKVRNLSGSGGTDGSLVLELVDVQTFGGLGVAVTVMAGVTVLGDGDLLPDAQHDVASSGHFGLHYPLNRRLILRAQLDAHGDTFEGAVEQLGGAALQGTLGASVALSQASWFELGFTEDLSGGGAPDVTFLVTFGARL